MNNLTRELRYFGLYLKAVFSTFPGKLALVCIVLAIVQHFRK